AMMAAA
nr:Chain A, AMMAAA [Homo sapiens]6CEW_B Chain B, AMMAAA [Homo sapiens]